MNKYSLINGSESRMQVMKENGSKKVIGEKLSIIIPKRLKYENLAFKRLSQKLSRVFKIILSNLHIYMEKTSHITSMKT